MSDVVEVLKRVGLGVVVAAVVVLAAVGLGNVMTAPGGVSPGAQHQAYAPGELAPDRLESSGTPDPSGNVGTVLIDQSRSNRFDREDVAPLVDAITRAGGRVQFPPPNADMGTTLSGVDVLVVVDPGSEYGRTDVESIRQFLDRGGRVVIFGEPNRNVVEQQQQVQAVLSTERSHLTTLGSAFGISFGTQYLYDQQHNDGNFKNVLVGPPDNVSHPLVRGVDDVALDTAASVSADGGTVLLRTADTAKQGTSGQGGGFPVAVVNAGGNVLAVGDKGFLEPEFASVGDNDVFIARIVEFMADADGQGSSGGNATLGRPIAPVTTPADSATVADSGRMAPSSTHPDALLARSAPVARTTRPAA